MSQEEDKSPSYRGLEEMSTDHCHHHQSSDSNVDLEIEEKEKKPMPSDEAMKYNKFTENSNNRIVVVVRSEERVTYVKGMNAEQFIKALTSNMNRNAIPREERFVMLLRALGVNGRAKYGVILRAAQTEEDMFDFASEMIIEQSRLDRERTKYKDKYAFLEEKSLQPSMKWKMLLRKCNDEEEREQRFLNSLSEAQRKQALTFIRLKGQTWMSVAEAIDIGCEEKEEKRKEESDARLEIMQHRSITRRNDTICRNHADIGPHAINCNSESCLFNEITKEKYRLREKQRELIERAKRQNLLRPRGRSILSRREAVISLQERNMREETQSRRRPSPTRWVRRDESPTYSTEDDLSFPL